VRDRESGETFSSPADNVINATGVWADRLRPDELHDEAEVPIIRPSRGTTSPAQRGRPARAGAIVPAGGGRSIFALPWLGRTLSARPTSTTTSPTSIHVAPSGEDIDYLLTRPTATSARLGPGDITGAYAGVRPLISTGDPRSPSTSAARPSSTRPRAG
jgi:glycerol-3-phosphate dehydrogenase